MELRILELSNGEKLISGLKKDVIINDNGTFKLLRSTPSLYDRLQYKQVPKKVNGVAIVKTFASVTGISFVKKIAKQFKGEVKVITDYTNMLLLAGVTRVLQEDKVMTPDKKVTYKNDLFLGNK